jgi:hypothetical protein
MTHRDPACPSDRTFAVTTDGTGHQPDNGALLARPASKCGWSVDVERLVKGLFVWWWQGSGQAGRSGVNRSGIKTQGGT